MLSGERLLNQLTRLSAGLDSRPDIWIPAAYLRYQARYMDTGNLTSFLAYQPVYVAGMLFG
jgi:hypothetical protein